MSQEFIDMVRQDTEIEIRQGFDREWEPGKAEQKTGTWDSRFEDWWAQQNQ